MSQTENAKISAKDFLVTLPLFGGALALAYDVGFFWQLDIAYFTAFSLSEHIVFALQALPFAMAGAATLGVIHLSIEKGAEDFDKKFPAAPRDENHARELLGELRTFQSSQKRRVSWMFAAMTPIVLVLWVMAELRTLATIIFLSGLATLLGVHFPKSVHRAPFGTMFLALSVIVTSFVVGLDVFSRTLRSVQQSHSLVVGSERVEGRIIRTGERGILFLQVPAQELTLVPWADVKRINSISATPPPKPVATPAPTPPSANK